MRRTILFAASLMVWTFASSQGLTLAELKAKNATQLTAAELRELLPDAKVVELTDGGSTHRWQNKADGTFIASTDGRGSNGGRNSFVTGAGTWQVTEDAKLCITVKWPTNPEDWCRYVFKADGKYYVVSRQQDTAQARLMEISK